MSRTVAAGAATRTRIAVIAGEEVDRAALSLAFARHARLRVTCSIDLDRAEEVLDDKDVDAIVGFIDGQAEWEKYYSLAKRYPDLLSVALVSEPAQMEVPEDSSVLNAIIQSGRDEITSRINRAVDGLDFRSVLVATVNLEDARKLELLSDREREVLVLTAQGLSLKEIAARLHRGYGTVATHRNNIMEKVGLHDRVALTRFTIRTGLVEP